PGIAARSGRYRLARPELHGAGRGQPQRRQRAARRRMYRRAGDDLRVLRETDPQAPPPVCGVRRIAIERACGGPARSPGGGRVEGGIMNRFAAFIIALLVTCGLAAPARAESSVSEFAAKVNLDPLARVAVHSDGRVKSFDSHARAAMQFIS